MPHVRRLAVLFLLAGCNLVKGPPRDHECRANLRSIIALETAFYSEQHRYSTHPSEIGFAPSRGNRYVYLFARDGALTRRDDLPSPPLREAVGYGPDTKVRKVSLEPLLREMPANIRDTLGLEGECPSCDITIACVGNVDDDAQVDVWSISTRDREGGVQGTPIHHLNDLANEPVKPPEPACTGETKLVEGVPGSPGHLLPSSINPNGASELATLMRRFVADWKAARQTLEAGGNVAPRFPSHAKLRCAWPTDPADRNAQFDTLAVGYLDAVKRFDESPGQRSYEGVINACAACHEVTCGGPLEVINQLHWK